MRFAAWIAAGVVSACAMGAHAGTERYEYDSLGRLIRYINPAGQLTEYIYDAVGNILEVRRSTDVGPPTITLASPGTVRRGLSVTIEVQGTRLAGAQVTSPHPALDIAGLRSTATLLSFVLTTAETAPLGPQSFSASNAFGRAGFSLTVEPALPTIVADPSPVVLLPAGQQQVTLRLSNPDQIAHSVTLTVANPAVASVNPTSVQLAPGQTEATVTITALALGNSALNIGSATLAGQPVGIYVSAAQTGPGSRYARNVGVVRQAAPQPTPVGPVVAPNVGIVRLAAPQPASAGPIVAPSVGVTRESEIGALGSPVGPLVAPNVGVERQ